MCLRSKFRVRGHSQTTLKVSVYQKWEVQATYLFKFFRIRNLELVVRYDEQFLDKKVVEIILIYVKQIDNCVF